MKITKRQLRRIIKEEKVNLLREGFMKQRHMEISDAILDAVDTFPGLSGDDIINHVTSTMTGGSYQSDPGPGMSIDKEEIYAVLDDLLEDGAIFFDEEEDAWFEFQEDLLSFRGRRNF